MFGGRIGIGLRSAILSVDIFGSKASSDGSYDLGGGMGYLGLTAAWTLSRFLILEAGVGMQYYSLTAGNREAEAFMAPVHFGATFRIPMGPLALGLRSTVSIAYDKDGGAYFSSLVALVFQKL